MRRHARLVAARTLSPTVRELTIEVDPASDGTPFTWSAGQYVEVFVPTKGLTYKRAYSIASAPGFRGPGTFDIAVTRTNEGRSSDSLHTHALDAEYEVEGPRGGFVRRDKSRPALFIGAGTGFAPIRALLQDELAAPDGPPLAMLFGARNEEHVLWRDEIESWEKSGRVRTNVSLSQGSDSWRGLRGYVQTHAVKVYRELGDADVFVCGLSAMVIDVVRALEGIGVDSAAIYSESYD